MFDDLRGSLPAKSALWQTVHSKRLTAFVWRRRSRAIVRFRTDSSGRKIAGYSSSDLEAVMVKNETDAVRRQVEILARLVLVAMLTLLTIGAVKLIWSWPAEPILQFLRFH